MFTKFKIVPSVLMTLLLTPITLANVPEKEADKLGKELTPIGALKIGNSAGTIPEWTGGSVNLQNFIADESGRPINPYPSDKPLFIINIDNMDEHAAQLTDGQMALLKAYPDTLNFPIYQSRRSASYPEAIYKKAKQNALTAQLTNDGNKVANFNETVPFPIPNSGLEIVWNHVMRYRGGSARRNYARTVSQRGGDHLLIKLSDEFVVPYYLKGQYDAERDSNLLFYYMQRVTAPARLSGTVLLVHETIDQVKQPRKSWIYNSGQRRVRRAPQVAYDSPGSSADGLSTTDNFDLFNGAPDRYNWKLMGKTEKYIPYNSFLLMDGKLKYDDITLAKHINPKHTRYELHRVWVVEGSLKSGKKHIYAKRRFYIDEDTWQIGLADHYDKLDNLWRVAEGHEVQYPQINSPWIAIEVMYDLMSNRYLTTGLTNEEKNPFEFNFEARRKNFTPAALRRRGR